jgi:hypothetical protein
VLLSEEDDGALSRFEQIKVGLPAVGGEALVRGAAVAALIGQLVDMSGGRGWGFSFLLSICF